MFVIQETEGALRTLELRDTASDGALDLAPMRGGMLARCSLRGKPLLFLDPVSFLDTSTNVRGGVPVLFPSPGKLTGDTWTRDGKTGLLKQHGFARSLPWEVAARSTDGAASATLRLASSAATLSAWPWKFALEIKYTLAAASLRLDVRVVNDDTTPMPFGFGLHPYFAVESDAKPRLGIATKATRAFDNVAKKEVPFEGFRFGDGEVDLHLLDHGSSETTVDLPDVGRLVIRCSEEFQRWVVWSLKGRDFVCVEPWTCGADALNTGEQLLHVAPGSERALSVEFTLDRA